MNIHHLFKIIQLRHKTYQENKKYSNDVYVKVYPTVYVPMHGGYYQMQKKYKINVIIIIIIIIMKPIINVYVKFQMISSNPIIPLIIIASIINTTIKIKKNKYNYINTYQQIINGIK